MTSDVEAEREGGVYVDSPIPAALRQIVPFYRQGVFTSESTPLFMRRRASTGFGVFASESFEGVPVTMVGRKTALKLPVRRGGTIFYGFNSQGNLHTVSNRSYRHVLVLHGESNKRASARPAARIYDYVCVAGSLAIDRYIAGGIFHQRDVDLGRLIQVGDTFVQSLGSYRVDPAEGEAILYAPTWEGYGGSVNDYSTVSRGGMEMAEEALRLTGRGRLVIRPHPYLGLLRPSLAKTLVDQARHLAKRYEVLFDLSDANPLVKGLVRIAMAVGTGMGYASGRESLSLCLCDISAMESVCLKAGLPHMILAQNFVAQSQIKDFYAKKSAASVDDVKARLMPYLSDPEEVDLPHRMAAFSVAHPDLSAPDGAKRIDRLLKIVAANEFWR